MKLIVGLGNPGSYYSATRHNIGFWVIDAIGAGAHIILRSHLPTAAYGEGMIAAQPVALAKPLTYMNASGKAVADLCSHFSILPNDLIVVHDDLDLQLGRIKLKMKGGHAGHYGVRSIIEHLGTGEFIRVRLGIGRPASKDEVAAFVLSPFSPTELALVHDTVRQALETVETCLR